MKELNAFGLSDNEIAVYIELLKTGVATANTIARQTGIKRSTTYDNLQLLVNKGIASRMEKDNVQYYEAADPKLLVQLLEDRRNTIQRIIPHLEKIQNIVKEQSSVSMFEGLKGAFQLLDDVLHHKELLFYGSRKMTIQILSHYPESFRMKRVEKKIKLKAVMAWEDKEDPFYKIGNAKKYTQVRYSKEMNKISANVFIYGNNVSFLSSSEHRVGCIIRNKDIADQQRAVFNLLWHQGKK